MFIPRKYWWTNYAALWAQKTWILPFFPCCGWITECRILSLSNSELASNLHFVVLASNKPMNRLRKMDGNWDLNHFLIVFTQFKWPQLPYTHFSPLSNLQINENSHLLKTFPPSFFHTQISTTVVFYIHVSILLLVSELEIKLFMKFDVICFVDIVSESHWLQAVDKISFLCVRQVPMQEGTF